MAGAGVRARAVRVGTQVRELGSAGGGGARAQHSVTHEPPPQKQRVQVWVRREGACVEQPVASPREGLPAERVVATLCEHAQSIQEPKGRVERVGHPGSTRVVRAARLAHPKLRPRLHRRIAHHVGDRGGVRLVRVRRAPSVDRATRAPAPYAPPAGRPRLRAGTGGMKPRPGRSPPRVCAAGTLRTSRS
eukprot:scaffold84678_cov64-Phaeocystis_antarctica.AAC.6